MARKDYFLAGVVMGSTQIPQIREQSMAPGVQEIIEAYDGQVDPSFAAVMTVMSKMPFTTTALATALTAVGIGGASSAADFYWVPAIHGGTRDTTACVKGAVTSSLFCVEQIEAAENSFASVSLTNYPCSDGDSPAVVMTTGVTLPSPVMTRSLYTVGPVKVNGALIDGVTSISVRFGLEVAHETDSGRAYPTLAYIRSRKPRITVRTTNVEQVAALGLFAPQGASQSKVFFRKMAAGSTRVPNATAQHISIAQSAGLVIARNIPGSNDQPSMAELEFGAMADGTNAVLAVNTATAIS